MITLRINAILNITIGIIYIKFVIYHSFFETLTMPGGTLLGELRGSCSSGVLPCVNLITNQYAVLIGNICKLNESM